MSLLRIGFILGFALVALSKQRAFSIELTTSLPSDFVRADDSEDSGQKSYNFSEAWNRQQSSVAKTLAQSTKVHSQERGPEGQVQFVSIGGGNSAHTLVLLDGFEINDPGAPDGIADISWIDPNSIESAEVYVGPQSGRFGSSAMGGVLLLRSREKISSKTNTQTRIRIASSDTKEFSATGIQGSSGSTTLIHFNQMETAGYSVAKAKDIELESDGSLKRNLFLKYKTRMTDKAWNKTVFIANLSEAELDQGGGFEGDDSNFSSEQELYLLGNEIAFRSAGFEHSLQIQAARFNRSYIDAADDLHPFDLSEDYFGRREKFEYMANKNLREGVFRLGIGGVNESFKMESADEEHKDLGGYGFVQGDFAPGNLIFGFAYRLENRFREETVGFDSHKIKVGTKINTHTALLFENASGYKIPSLSQYYDRTYGNESLLPERVSRNALAIQLSQKDLEWTADIFEQNYRDLIEYSFSSKKSDNLSSARVSGASLSARWQPTGSDRFGFSAFHFIEKKNLETDTELLNRPDWKLAINFWKKFGDELSLRAEQVAVGDYEDTNYRPPYSRYKNSGFSITNLGLGFDFTDTVLLDLAIDNAFDLEYEKLSGFSTQRRSYSLALKAIF